MTSENVAYIDRWAAWRALIDELVGQPFKWGETDCVAVALKLSDALTGADRWGSVWASRWGTEAEALAVLEAVGGFIAALEASGGAQVARNFHRRGDWLLVESEQYPFPMIHVYAGDTSISADPERGVIALQSRAVLALDPTVYRLP